MPTFSMPTGYEKIDGRIYNTTSLQKAAYDDIRLQGRSGSSGAFLYGKHRLALIWPLDKVFITQPFGANPKIYAPMGLRGHDGIDLRTRFIDSPLAHRYVVAAAGGIADVRNYGKSGYGLHIRITHTDGSQTIYGHLSKTYIVTGQRVERGGRIGLTGNTGFSSGPHLHFEYRPTGWENNKDNGYAGAVDPLPFMIK